MIRMDAHTIVDGLGHESTETNIEQMEVLIKAFDKFVERNAVYRDLWRNGGPRDSANHIESKAARVQHFTTLVPGTDWSLSEVEAPLDDALDLINYAAFYIRNIVDANLSHDQIVNMGCELRERRWPGNPWPCTHSSTVLTYCPVHGVQSDEL